MKFEEIINNRKWFVNVHTKQQIQAWGTRIFTRTCGVLSTTHHEKVFERHTLNDCHRQVYVCVCVCVRVQQAMVELKCRNWAAKIAFPSHSIFEPPHPSRVRSVSLFIWSLYDRGDLSWWRRRWLSWWWLFTHNRAVKFFIFKCRCLPPIY